MNVDKLYKADTWPSGMLQQDLTLFGYNQKMRGFGIVFSFKEIINNFVLPSNRYTQLRLWNDICTFTGA